jgi:hypothetical protein
MTRSHTKLLLITGEIRGRNQIKPNKKMKQKNFDRNKNETAKDIITTTYDKPAYKDTLIMKVPEESTEEKKEKEIKESTRPQ